MRRGRILAILFAGLAFLSACQTELYTNLSEREANLMLAALLEQGLDASKTSIGDANFAVTVEKDDVQDALQVLDALGLPQRDRESIGQVFAKSGIVSSPFEERVRYIYALGEEVAQTLQQIDGVLVARVHIVMPEAPELGQEAKPSSAAVFIKQRLGFDLDFLMPQIRRLVANSIEGVEYEGVTVVLVESQSETMPVRDTSVQFVEPVPGLAVTTSSVTMLWGMMGGAGGVVLLLLFGMGYLLYANAGLKKRVLADDDMDA